MMSIPASNENKITINYDEYKEKPDELFLVARGYFRKKQFEEGLEVLEKSIELAVSLYGSEGKIEMAKFYNKYAEGLIQKLMENNEIIAMPQTEVNKGDNKESQKNEEKEDEKDENDNNDNEGEEPQEETDEQIAFENLSAANALYLAHLQQYDKIEDIKQLSQKEIDYYLELADNYFNFGELEQAESDFKKASEYFSQAVSIRKKYGEKYSRTLAEIYFKLASVLDYDPKKCLLCFYKAELIMIYHLNELLKKKNLNIKLEIDDKSLELSEISEKDEKLYLNRKIIESNEMKALAEKNEDIEDLTGIISELYLKIDDVVLEINEFDKYLKEKNQMKQDSLDKKGDHFTEDYDKSKVIDISTSAVIRKKRPRTPDEDDKEIIAQKEKVEEKDKK